MPSWSPDGAWLAASDGDSILKVASSGGAAPLTLKRAAASDCQWSPDGRWIAYTSTDGTHLLKPDETADRLLFGAEHPVSCDLTADGKRYVCLEQHNQRDIRLVTWDVAAGREIRSVPLQLDASSTAYGISPHPDGTRFATAVGKVDYDLWMVEGFPQPATGLMSWFRPWTDVY